MTMTMTKEQTSPATLVSDALANRLLESVVGSGPVNPLEGLIMAGMTEGDAEFLRDYLNDATTRDGGKMMRQLIAHFAASCARIAPQEGL